MIHLTTAAFFFLLVGILTSVSLIGVSQILLGIPAAYFLYKAFINKDFKFSKSSFFFLIFFICALVSLLTNIDALKNPLKSFGKLKFLFFALGTIPVLYYWLPKVKASHLRNLIHIFFCSIIVAGTVAIYQAIISGGGRSEGLTGIMRYGYASAMILGAFLGVILHREKFPIKFNTKLAVLAFLFGLTGLLLTQTRGALAGFVSALPFVLYFYRPKLGLAVGLMSALFISILAYAYLFGTGDYGTRLLKSKNELGDVVRQEQWQSAIIATKEHPWFGWGYNNFYSQVERIKKENNLQTTFYINEHSHNTFLEVAAGTGIVGFFFFFLWLVTWAYECFKLENHLRGIFVPFGVSLISSGQFEVVLDTNNAALIFFVYSLSQYAVIKSKLLK